MKTREKIYKELFASQKVELGSVKELQKVISDIKSNFSEIEKRYNQLASELAQAERTRRAVNDALLSGKSSALNVAQSLINDFKQKAKELGVDVSNVSEIKEIEKLQQTAREYDKLIQSIGKIPNI